MVSDTDEFRYTTMTEGEEQYAGIMDARRVPARGDAVGLGGLLRGGGRRRLAGLAERLGGTVLEPAVDTPHGRMAKVADPTGATFKIVAASS